MARRPLKTQRLKLDSTASTGANRHGPRPGNPDTHSAKRLCRRGPATFPTICRACAAGFSSSCWFCYRFNPSGLKGRRIASTKASWPGPPPATGATMSTTTAMRRWPPVTMHPAHGPAWMWTATSVTQAGPFRSRHGKTQTPRTGRGLCQRATPLHCPHAPWRRLTSPTGLPLPDRQAATASLPPC